MKTQRLHLWFLLLPGNVSGSFAQRQGSEIRTANVPCPSTRLTSLACILALHGEETEHRADKGLDPTAECQNSKCLPLGDRP